jgi:hypothetical protein
VVSLRTLPGALSLEITATLVSLGAVTGIISPIQLLAVPVISADGAALKFGSVSLVAVVEALIAVLFLDVVGPVTFAGVWGGSGNQFSDGEWTTQKENGRWESQDRQLVPTIPVNDFPWESSGVSFNS